MSAASPQALAEAQAARIKALRAAFETRVRRYEHLSRANPSRYRLLVLLFGWLAYGYIGLVLLLLLGIVGGIIAMLANGHVSAAEIKILIFAVVILGAVAKSLWVVIDPPEGVLLSRNEAPRLFQEVEALAAKLGAPRPDQIKVDMDFNAAAAQTPRLGLFGFYTNTLIVGLPLLMTLSADEARAVIAHEFGHFSGKHGKAGVRAYRLNQVWEQLEENLYESGKGAWLFAWFVHWFTPRYAAMTFALRRQHEYEADRAAAEVVGKDTTARMLMKLPFLHEHVDSAFWKPLYELAKTTPEPPKQAFAKMPAALAAAPSQDLVKVELQQALNLKTGYADTHPSLTDRLRSLGSLPAKGWEAIAARLAEPVNPTAAEVFFGPSLPGVLARLEVEHMGNIRDGWRLAHQKHDKASKQLQDLEWLKSRTEEQDVTRAVLTLELKGPEAAEPILCENMDRYPKNAVVKFHLGCLLLDRDDEAGVPLVDEAMRLDSSAALVCRQVLAEFFAKRGEHHRVDELRGEFLDARARRAAAEHSLAQLRPVDKLLPPNRSAEEIGSIRQRLETVERLHVAYLVRKVLPGTGEERDCLIVFPLDRYSDAQATQEVIRKVSHLGIVSGGGAILCPEHKKMWMGRLDTIPGAKMYEKQKTNA